jgi:hypothetical protein
MSILHNFGELDILGDAASGRQSWDGLFFADYNTHHHGCSEGHVLTHFENLLL